MNIFKRTIAKAVGYYTVCFDCGLEKYAKGDLDGAIEDFTKAIALKPDYDAAYNNRGIAKRAKGDLEGAIKDSTQAIELRPACAAYFSRGHAKGDKGDLDGAIADYTEAIELKPDYAAAYKYRGDAKRGKGDLDGANADHTKATQLKKPATDATPLPDRLVIRCQSCKKPLRELAGGFYFGGGLEEALQDSPFKCKSCGIAFCSNCMAKLLKEKMPCPACGKTPWS